MKINKSAYMEDHILDPLGKDINALHNIFRTIAGGNTILFLGAGASITNKQYLSEQIISYYEDKIGKTFNISNITEFVDVLSETKSFDRAEFDRYVHELLQRLKVNDTHKTILSIFWRQIISTNFDMLLEKAEEEVKGTSAELYELVKVRSVREIHQLCDNTQVKYIKLNGCMSDRSAYPFRFSTNDFAKAKVFYRSVLNELKSVSDRINFLAVGYSFSDDFAFQLLKEYDKYNYRERKPLWCVEPFPNDFKLDFYKKQKMLVIKCSTETFFLEYKKWEEQNYKERLKIRPDTFATAGEKPINVGYKLAFKLKGVIEQLNRKYIGRHVSEEKFYRGEEPDYVVVSKGFDVVKRKKVAEVEKKIQSILKEKHPLIPIIFLTGNFGTGKTTFNYRIIHSLINNSANETVAFEIVDIGSLRREALKELIENVQTKNVILYCNDLEIEGVYKAIIELRTYLSAHQLKEITIFFLLSIRENILEVHKTNREVKNAHAINIDIGFDRDETIEFVEKLRKSGLIDFRDIRERNAIVTKIERNYKGDSFVALLNLVSNGRHIDDLRDAYVQLSKDCQKAFVYTALIHRFDLMMSASVLRKLVATDWDDFRNRVINVEGKGILIQEEHFSRGIDSDIYFRTKHSLIAEKLIGEIIKSKERRFLYYQHIIKAISPGTKTSRFLNELLKTLRREKEFPPNRIAQLYDLAYKTFQDDPFFLLQYSINLQARAAKDDLERAIEYLIYGESLLEWKNDRFIHRRGVLNFRLAQKFYDKEKELNFTFKYLEEAKDLLLLKQQMDPSSSYSYFDLLDLLIWEIEKIEYSMDEQIVKRIVIEDFFELAYNTITEGFSSIVKLNERYSSQFQKQGNLKEYKRSLDEMYENADLRPYTCILLHNFYSKNKDESNRQIIFDEIELYSDIDEIAKFLFKHYGRNLQNPNIRIKFFKLSRKMEWYEEENPLRYNYYNYVAEAYNSQFQLSFQYLSKINGKFPILNPEYKITWSEPDSSAPRIFNGTIIKSAKGFRMFRSKELMKDFWFSFRIPEDVKFGDHCNANLAFHLNGIKAVFLNRE
jgi:hypothetical protein